MSIQAQRMELALRTMAQWVDRYCFPVKEFAVRAAPMNFGHVVRELQTMNQAGFGTLGACSQVLQSDGSKQAHRYKVLQSRLQDTYGEAAVFVGAPPVDHPTMVDALRVLDQLEGRTPGMGGSALIRAVVAGDLTRVQTLLRLGVDASIVSQTGETAVMQAVYRDRAAMIPFLAAAGAEIDARDTVGWTPLLTAVTLPAAGSLVRELLAAGANANASTPDGRTPLILASLEAESEVIELLIGAGAHVNAQTTTGQTALMVAAEAGDWTTVNRLLLAGADINARNAQGQTALTMAVRRHHNDLAQRLRDEGGVE